MKKFLVILFALIFVVSAGLLAYGAIKGPKKVVELDEISLAAPAAGLFADEYADQVVDISAIAKATGMQDNQKVAEMIINASYNNILIDQFYYKAHAEVQATQSDERAFSDYFRAKTGANMFFMTLAYTGSINPVKVKIDYVDQRIETTDAADYEEDTGWSYTVKAGRAKTKEVSLPELTAYNIYSWYDFPLDLGGVKRMSDKSTAGRTEDIDGSLIDVDSVEIEELGDEHPYYRLTFKAIIADTNASEESIDRFADSCGSISNVTLHKLNFTVEIWKEAGVFRRIGFEAIADASMRGKNGEVEISKMLEFSYADTDASVAAHIKKLADDFDPKWITNFSAENQQKIADELAKLPAKTDDAETESEED